MKRRVLFLALVLCGCGYAPKTAETETEAQSTAETEKVSEIDTDEATEPTLLKAYKVFKVEKQTEEEPKAEIDVNGYGWVELQYSEPYEIMDGHLTRSNGSIRCFGHRETWYSTNEGCGKTTARSIPGKHVADDGTIRDEDGFICVASSDLSFYSIVMTSVGPGKVYDCGCSHGTIDVYTNW